MSFGYSIGDFIAGANLCYKLIRALSETRGASVEYQEAILELGCIQQTFFQVGHMLSNPNLSIATVNAASHIVMSSIDMIGDYLEKTKKYRQTLSGHRSGNAISDSWQKMGYALFKKEELKSLRDSLNLKISSISVLLTTIKTWVIIHCRSMVISNVLNSHEALPKSIARYEVESCFLLICHLILIRN